MGQKAIRRWGIALAFAGLTTVMSGCYGQFALVDTLYKANGNVENKWARSGLTALLVILPVYEFAGLGDVIIFNPIEFWTHVNPITNKPSVASDRTVGPGVDPTKTPDGWLSKNNTSGQKVVMAWHYDRATQKLSAIGIARGANGKTNVTLYRSRWAKSGQTMAGPQVTAVTFDHGHPVTKMAGTGAI